MPKPKEEEVVKDEITDAVIDPGHKEDVAPESAGIEVDVEPKQEVKKVEPLYVTQEHFDKLQKQFNGISQTLRHVKDIPGQIADLQRVINSRFASTAEKKEAKDELDEMLEKGDWRTPVEKLAEKKFQAMLEDRDRQYQANQEKQQKLSVLESSKRTVREKYADIDDAESEIARRYQKVLSEKPQYLTNEFGPVLAMRDMEEELRAEGKLDEFSKKAVDKEVARRTRVGASAVPAGNVTGGTGKIMLTKEQKEFCDAAGLKYESYAKNLRRQKEGVEA